MKNISPVFIFCLIMISLLFCPKVYADTYTFEYSTQATADYNHFIDTFDHCTNLASTKAQELGFSNYLYYTWNNRFPRWIFFNTATITSSGSTYTLNFGENAQIWTTTSGQFNGTYTYCEFYQYFMDSSYSTMSPNSNQLLYSSIWLSLSNDNDTRIFSITNNPYPSISLTANPKYLLSYYNVANGESSPPTPTPPEPTDDYPILTSFYTTVVSSMITLTESISQNYIYISIFCIFILISILYLIKRRF